MHKAGIDTSPASAKCKTRQIGRYELIYTAISYSRAIPKDRDEEKHIHQWYCNIVRIDTSTRLIARQLLDFHQRASDIGLCTVKMNT